MLSTTFVTFHMLACFDMKEIFHLIFEALPGKCLRAVIAIAFLHVILLHHTCAISAVTADMKLATISAIPLFHDLIWNACLHMFLRLLSVSFPALTLRRRQDHSRRGIQKDDIIILRHRFRFRLSFYRCFKKSLSRLEKRFCFKKSLSRIERFLFFPESSDNTGNFNFIFKSQML